MEAVNVEEVKAIRDASLPSVSRDIVTLAAAVAGLHEQVNEIGIELMRIGNEVRRAH